LNTFYVTNYEKCSTVKHKIFVEICRPRRNSKDFIPSQPLNLIFRIFHYIGLGFPVNKESPICLGNGYNPQDWSSMKLVKLRCPLPALYIFDCDIVANLKPFLLEAANGLNPQIIWEFFACRPNEKYILLSHCHKKIFSRVL
jgi:hypothetical protein